MSDFTILIVYCSLIYLIVFLLCKEEMSSKDNKKDIWDHLFLWMAPIGVPILIIGALFKIMLE